MMRASPECSAGVACCAIQHSTDCIHRTFDAIVIYSDHRAERGQTRKINHPASVVRQPQQARQGLRTPRPCVALATRGATLAGHFAPINLSDTPQGGFYSSLA